MSILLRFLAAASTAAGLTAAPSVVEAQASHAFGTTPQCSPSRISTLTGSYAHAVDAEDLHTPLPEGERILTFFLQEQGYFTGHMAKTHYGPSAERQSYHRGAIHQQDSSAAQCRRTAAGGPLGPAGTDLMKS